MDNQALFNLSYGLYVVTANYEGRDNGCIINTAVQVTDSPKKISVTINKENLTCEMIKSTGVFNISILTENSKFELYKHWGFQSGRDVDKTQSIEFSRANNGVIYLTKDVNSYISARVTEAVDLGTHLMFIADVEDAKVINDDLSVTYAYYHKNIKQQKSEAKKGYVCMICGYIYEGDELPDDFICPWCKHPASDFKKI